MKAITSKLILAVLCALAIISVVSGKSLSLKGNLRGKKEVENINEERALKKSSKSPKGKGGKGGKGKDKKGKKDKKCKKRSVKSSKSPKSKGKGGKGKKGEKSSKEPKSGKGKGGKGKNKSSKAPKSKGKGGKGYYCDEPATPSPVQAPVQQTSFPNPTMTFSPSDFASVAPSAGPTNSCGISDEQRILGIRNILSSVSSLTDIDTRGTPQNIAYNWLISDDPNNQFVCPQTRRVVLQRYILAVIYFSTDGDNWDRCSRVDTNCRDNNGLAFQPFLSNMGVCKWFGITCLDGAITGVVLGGRNFVGVNGDIPSELFFLPQVQEISFDGSRNDNEPRRIAGKIPPEIGNAVLLEELDLDRNELTGEIPIEIFDNIALRVLDLDNNMLTGIIPDKFDEMPRLGFLTIGNNMFAPQPMPSSITTLSVLRFLGLQDSSLTGEIPQSYDNLRTLVSLDIGDNDLTGTIDVIDNYPFLISLSVNDNRFDGDVPQSLWNNVNMEVIDLENNSFTGSISRSIGQMQGLQTLRLGGNNLTGAIPIELQDLNNLRFVTLQGNDFDAGSFVPEAVCTNNPGIEITIDASISCPGRCCVTVPV